MSNLCRLCVNSCREYKSINDTTSGQRSVYDITVKYFHYMFLNVEQEGGEHKQAVLCLECWHCIFGFYEFQESILLAQAKLLKDNKRKSPSSMEALADINNSNADVECLENDGLDTVDLSDIELMDIYSDSPSDPVQPLENLDSRNVAITPSTSEYIAERRKKSEEYDSFEDDDEDCSEIEEDDDPIGYFIPGNSDNTNADNDVGCSSCNLETIDISSSSEKDEMEYDENSEVELDPFKKSEENVNANFGTKPNDNTSPTGGVCLYAFDAFIALWKPHLECTICHQLESTFLQLQSHFYLNHPNDECHIICCNLVLKTRSIIENHIRSQHGTAIESSNKELQPNVETKAISCLDRYIEQYKQYLKCVICGEEQLNFGQLGCHFLQSHPQDECHIVCCRRRLKNRRHIEEHIRVHLDRTLFQCKICQMRKITLRDLRRTVIVLKTWKPSTLSRINEQINMYGEPFGGGQKATTQLKSIFQH